MEYSYYGKEQKVYYEQLDNGLKVYMLPNKNINSFCINLVTRYGSDVKEFIPLGKKDYESIPRGLAHFLEHKVFDIEKGDAFSLFSKYGAYSNAATSNLFTKYYVIGKKNFKKCLENLLNLVYTPYITQETINKEIGIISEEIRMYHDETDWQLEKHFRDCFFNGILNLEIAGSEESIRTITKEMLFKVYDTFYQPSNMMLVVTGNFKNQDVLTILKNNEALNNKVSLNEIVYKDEKDIVKVSSEYQEFYGNIVYPKFKYGFKIDLDSFAMKDKIKLELYLDAFFSLMYGDVSEFNDYNLENKLSNWYYIGYGKVKDNIYCFDVTAESEYADLFVEKVDKVLINPNILQEDFERLRKIWIASSIRRIDDCTYLCDSFMQDILTYQKIIDHHELIDCLDFQEFLSVIKKIDFNNKTFVLMLPNKE